MLVRPLPGTTCEHLLAALREVHISAVNVRSRSGPGTTAQGRLAQYIDWTTLAVQYLGNQVAPADLSKLVLTPGYERLLAGLGTITGTDIGTQRALNGLVSHELDQRVEALDGAVKALAAQIARWNRPGVFVVADTSVYIEHWEKLEILDFRTLLKIREEPVHLLVPIIIVDELDGLKKSANREARWRAGYTVAVFDRVFSSSSGPVRFTAEDFTSVDSGGIPRGEVTIELVFDSPGHVRLPINDDEIIDRTLAIQGLVGRGVTLMTYDTGQSMRARSAGLNVVKLSRLLEEEPVAAKNGRAR